MVAYDPVTFEPLNDEEQAVSRRQSWSSIAAGIPDFEPMGPMGPQGPEPGGLNAAVAPPHWTGAFSGANYGDVIGRIGSDAMDAFNPEEIINRGLQVPESLISRGRLPQRGDPDGTYGTRLGETLERTPVVGGTLRKALQFAQPGTTAKFALTAAAGSEALGEAGERIAGEGGRTAGELAGSFIGPTAFNRGATMLGAVDDTFRSAENMLARTNKIRASRGLEPLKALPSRPKAQPILPDDGSINQDAVDAIQAKVAKEGMTPQNRALLDEALGRVFKVDDVVPPPPVRENPRVAGNLDRMLNPGKLEGQAAQIDDAMARARETPAQRAKAAFDATKKAQTGDGWIDDIPRTGPNTDTGAGLQARVFPVGSPASQVGALVGAAGGYATADEDATPVERLGRAAVGAGIGAVGGRVAGGAVQSWRANPLQTAAQQVAEQASAGKVDAAQQAYRAASDAMLRREPGAFDAFKRAARSLDDAQADYAARTIPVVVEPMKAKMLRVATDIANVPRTTMASIDLSGSLRQAGFLAPRHRTEWKNAMGAQFKALASEEKATAIQREIMDSPMAKYRKTLYQADWNGTDIGQREEQFMSAIAGDLAGVKQTSRAYALMLNKYRADVFDSVVSKWPEGARTPERLAQFERYVEAATGRGTLPEAMKDMAPVLNALFFSPRFLISIPQRHLAAFTRDSYIRNEVLKDLGAFYGTGLTLLGTAIAAKQFLDIPDSELSVNVSDFQSPDWGKIKVGSQTIDIWGGQQQFARMIARTTAETPGFVQAVASGNASDLKPSENPLNVMTQFLRYKFSPVANLEEQLRTGKTAIGQPAPGAAETAARLVAPLILQEMYDAYQVGGAGTAAIAGIGSGIGLGVQTYEDKKPTRSTPSRPARPRPARPAKPSR